MKKFLQVNNKVLGIKHIIKRIRLIMIKID